METKTKKNKGVHKGEVISAETKARYKEAKRTTNSKHSRSRTQKARGTAEKTAEMMKEKFQKGLHEMGGNIEKIGKDLRKKGYANAGRAVEWVGNKLGAIH